MNKDVKFYVGAALTIAVLALALIGISAGAGEGLLPNTVQTSSAVQVPPALIQVFNGFLIALITSAFVWLLGKVGLDILSLAVPLALSLSTFLVGLVQNWINLQPVSSDPFIMTLLNILVIIFTGTGALAILARYSGKNTLF